MENLSKDFIKAVWATPTSMSSKSIHMYSCLYISLSFGCKAQMIHIWEAWPVVERRARPLWRSTLASAPLNMLRDTKALAGVEMDGRGERGLEGKRGRWGGLTMKRRYSRNLNCHPCFAAIANCGPHLYKWGPKVASNSWIVRNLFERHKKCFHRIKNL